jgi:hypothetical protein
VSVPGVAAGATVKTAAMVTVPAGTAPGLYRFGRCGRRRRIGEGDETNNGLVAAAMVAIGRRI